MGLAVSCEQGEEKRPARPALRSFPPGFFLLLSPDTLRARVFQSEFDVMKFTIRVLQNYSERSCPEVNFIQSTPEPGFGCLCHLTGCGRKCRVKNAQS
jgi:hypothetical protein